MNPLNDISELIRVQTETRTGDISAGVPQAVGSVLLDHFMMRDEPVYIYDTGLVRAMCRSFRIPYQSCAVHFATMANSNARFLKIIKEEGLNVFVNSLQHLRMVLDAGFRGSQIVYTASAMNDETMREVHSAGALVNLDSTGQINRWARLFPDVSFGIRLNIGSLVDAKKTRGGYFIGKESRLGLAPQEIDALKGNPRVHGLHIYVGTDICSVEYFRRCYETLAGFVTLFPSLSYLDFGGGFGFHDQNGKQFDLAAYGEMVASLMASINKDRIEPFKIILEPGRIIGAQAGYFACRIIDVKHTEGRRFVGVNASSVQFPRPLFYPDSAAHPVYILPSAASEGLHSISPATICGCSTYSRDYLAIDTLLPAVSEGDIIVFGEAGSYCASMYTTFLGFLPAREIFI